MEVSSPSVLGRSQEEFLGELAKVLVKTGALQFGTFRMTSGKLSSYYIDLRSLPSFPGAFRSVVSAYSKAIRSMIGVRRIDALAAIPTAGLTYASAVAYTMRKPLIYVRGEAKTHGTMKRIEGVLYPGWRVLVIDDLITTGSSILNAVTAVRKEGGVVEHALVLIDRIEGGKEALRKQNVTLHSISTIMKVTNVLGDLEMIDEDQLEAITQQLGKTSGGSR